MKIMLAPSNQNANLYSYGNTNELVQCVKIANACAEYLSRYDVEVFNGDSYKYGFIERIELANNQAMDLFLSIHTNAGGGRGVESWVDRTGKVDALGNLICRYIAALGVTNRGLKTRLHTDGLDWYTELRMTRMPALMVECAYHDNGTEARWIVEHVKEIGEAIARSVVAQYGLKLKSGVPTPAPEPKVLHRVQVGAFNVAENAMAVEKKLKDKGYDTYMIWHDNLIKVQTGAFADKTNAENLAKKLKADGFETYISTVQGKKYTPNSQSGSPEHIVQIRPGTKVRVKQGTKDWNGTQLLPFAYQTVYTVLEMDGDRVVIGLDGQITAAVHLNNLFRA